MTFIVMKSQASSNFKRNITNDFLQIMQVKNTFFSDKIEQEYVG